MRKSLSTNTPALKETIREAAATYHSKRPAQKRTVGFGLPPKMVSLDSQQSSSSSDAAAISAMSMQLPYTRFGSMAADMPPFRRAGEPTTFGRNINHNSHNDNDNDHAGPLGFDESMSGGMDMCRVNYNNSNNMGGLDAGATGTRRMNNTMGMNINTGMTMGMNSTGNNLTMNVSMNSSMNTSINAMNTSMNAMHFTPNMTNMNVVGNISQSSSSLHSSGGGWEMTPQEALLHQQQQQLLQLQQEQQRLQEQQRQLTEMIQHRAAAASQFRQSARMPPSSHSFNSYGSTKSTYDWNVASAATNDMMHTLRDQDASSNASMNMNRMSSGQVSAFGQRCARRHGSMSDLDRMDRPMAHEGYDPLPMESNLFVEHHDPSAQDESEVSFEEAIDNICYLGEPRNKSYDPRRKR
jgi:hypothetical protein